MRVGKGEGDGEDGSRAFRGVTSFNLLRLPATPEGVSARAGGHRQAGIDALLWNFYRAPGITQIVSFNIRPVLVGVRQVVAAANVPEEKFPRSIDADFNFSLFVLRPHSDASRGPCFDAFHVILLRPAPACRGPFDGIMIHHGAGICKT